MDQELKPRVGVVCPVPFLADAICSSLVSVGRYEVFKINRLRIPDTGWLPQLLLIDYSHEPKPTNRDLRKLRERGVGLVVITEKMSPAETEQLQHSGVDGFIALTDGPQEFRSAVAAVLSGGKWYSQGLPEFKGYAIPRLSDQELAALRLYVTGMKLEAVARKMGVAGSTAKEYIDRVRAKYSALGRPAPSKLHLHQNALEDGFLDGQT